MDRAVAHQESLVSSKEKGRVPARLKITIQPMVINKEQYQFQQDWTRTCREGEERLMTVLINHLDNTIAATRSEIRTESQNCTQQLIRLGLNKQQARISLTNMLKEAESIRKDNKEEAIRKKRLRRERSTSSKDAPPAKKPRTT